MTIYRLPGFATEADAIAWCRQRRYRLLSLERGPDGTWRGLATAGKRTGKGRKAVDAENARSITFGVRLTAAEYERLQALAAKRAVTVSALLRTAALGT